uniref:Tetratricopeptide repeat protein 21A/21B N-terminal ARM repeat domain-containing protein n=1 Tax=Gopherus agassizii TaxID=38772 RepID=A0A452H7S4_9SAUR
KIIFLLSSSLQAYIIYYAQEKYFNHVRQFANLELDKYINDPVFQFFKAYGTLHLGQIQDAILQLENARKCHSDVSLCCLLALIYAHKTCENVGEFFLSVKCHSSQTYKNQKVDQ